MQHTQDTRVVGRWIYVVGIALLCIVVLAGSFPGEGKWVRVLHDSGHGYVFALVGILCVLAWRRRHAREIRSVRQYVAAWLVATGIGLLTEIAQRYLSRDASWDDVAMDALGAAVGLSLLCAWERHRAREAGVWPAAVLAAIAAAVMLWPTFVMTAAYWQRNREFPVIARFDQFYGTYFLQPDNVNTKVVQLPRQWSRGAEFALEAEYLPSDWSIIVFSDFVPDWTDYQTLVVDIVNPQDETVPLSMRAHDAGHNFEAEDRFYVRFKLPPQSRQQLRIPLADIEAAPESRVTDLSRMLHFGLYKSGAKKPVTFYVVKVWLEGK